jgi:plasmid maintenance system antidote protein VapI
MQVFLTDQKRLAAAVGVSTVHLSNIKNGKTGVSDRLGDKLENATRIKKMVWATGSKKLELSLKRFFRDERSREMAYLKSMSM